MHCRDSSSIYYVGPRSTRLVFPNANTYYTWYSDFDDLRRYTCRTVNRFALSGVVTYRPGTFLVKLASSSNVYAVEPGGKLRWIPTEEHAKFVYGEHWDVFVHDVPEETWVSYKAGLPLAEGEIPTGTMYRLEGHESYYYMENRRIRRIPSSAVTDIHRQFARTRSKEFLTSLERGSIVTSYDLKQIDRQIAPTPPKRSKIKRSKLAITPSSKSSSTTSTSTTKKESFGLSKPNLKDPGGAMLEGGFYKLVWTPVPGATSYYLEEDDEPNFGKPRKRYVIKDDFEKRIQARVKKADQTVTYYYRLQARGKKVKSDWSKTVTMQVGPSHQLSKPFLEEAQLSPTDSGFVFMEWSSVENARRYIVEEDVTPFFRNPREVYAGPDTRVQFAHGTPGENGSVFYRVYAQNGLNESTFSGVREVVIPSSE